ncbi:MAG: threonine--tRNA ligase, partial [Chloroflexia bacterium]
MPARQDDPLLPLRHSTAHVMAQAVGDLFPGTRFGIGPAIADGFYYDFDLPRPLTPEDLEAIERRMREIIRADHPFVRREVTPEEARALFRDQPYKLELIEDLVAGRADEDGEAVAVSVPTLTTYTHDTFTDLCRGPHLERTGQIPEDGFKLLRVAGAYWRGDE